MSHPLFRREVLDAKRGSWLGVISLAQPPSLWLLTCVAVLAALLICIFLTFGTYTRRSTVAGQLVPSKGLATVLAPATGVVDRMDVFEGERVAAGQRVAVVTVPRATLGSGSTMAALGQRLRQRQAGLESAQAAQQQLFLVQASGLAAQLGATRRELAQVETEIATRQSQVHLANETLDRLRQLQDSKYVSLIQIKQQESAALDQISAMQSLQRQAIGTRRTIVQLQQSMRELPGQRQTAEANFHQDVAMLEQEQVETEARSVLAVNAPVAGLVATQLVKPGQAVQAGQPILSVLPGDGELEAELQVPSRAIGFVEPGDTVLLRYQAYPYQKFGYHVGHVASISRNAIVASETSSDKRSASDPYYRLVVRLQRQTVAAYGKQEPLKPGMLLEASLLGDRRRLFEWALEPLYSLKENALDP